MKNSKLSALIITLICLTLLSSFSYAFTTRSILVTDTSNNRVQILDYYSRSVVAVIGSKGSLDGMLLYPSSAAVDSTGSYVFVADTANNRIQKFDRGGTFIAAWGSPQGGKLNGQFSSPCSIATGMVNGTEYVYVADTGNNRIQVMNTAGVWVATWGSTKSGSGVNDFNNPQGLAFDIAGGFIYVADTFNHRIKKYTTAGVLAGVFGGYGTTDGKLNYPKDVSTGINQAIYVSDSLNYRIQKFSSDGTYLLKWGIKGSEAGQFKDIFEISVEQNGDIYAADAGNNRIQKFNSEGVFLNYIGGVKGTDLGYYNYPQGICVSEIFIEDTPTLTFTLTETPTDTATETYTETPTDTATETYTETPTDTATETYTETPTDTATETCTETPTDTATETHTETPTDTATETYTETPTNTATETFTETPTETSTSTPADTETSVNTPTSIPTAQSIACNPRYLFDFAVKNRKTRTISAAADVAVDNAGNIYITDILTRSVIKFDAQGNKLLTFKAVIQYPSGIEISREYVYVVDKSLNKIMIFDLNGNAISSFGGKGEGNGKFLMPSRVASAQDGCVYVTDTLNNRVQKFTAQGVFIKAFGTGFTCRASDGAPSLLLPGGITVMADQSVAVLDQGRRRIVFFDKDGSFISQISQLHSKQAKRPFLNWLIQDSDIAAAPDGSLYAAQPVDNRVIKISTTGELLWESGNGNVDNPYGLEVGSNGNLYAANAGKSSVSVFENYCPQDVTIGTLAYNKETPQPTVKPLPEELNKAGVYNYPNPFSSTTTLRFELAEQKDTKLLITDINGSPVWQTAIPSTQTIAGVNKLEWNGRNQNGLEISNGAYIMKVSAGSKTVSKKIVKIR